MTATYSPEQKIACLTREIAFRKRVYGRKVADGTMLPEKADHEIGCMQAILRDIERLHGQTLNLGSVMPDDPFDLTPFHLHRPEGKPYAMFAPQDAPEMEQLEEFLEAEGLVRQATEEYEESLLQKGASLAGAYHSAKFYFRRDLESNEPLVSESGEEVVVLVQVYVLRGKSAVATWMAFAVRPEDLGQLEMDLGHYMDLVRPALEEEAILRTGGGGN
jgi:hypothetical protein